MAAVTDSSAPVAGPVTVDTFVLSPLQRGMLFAHLTDPHSVVDVVQLTVETAQPLDEAPLRKAWQLLIQQHPALRTAIRWQDVPEPVQEIHAHADVAFTARCGEDDAAFDAYIEDDRRRGFDLDVAPLFRIALLTSTAGRTRLVCTFHHIIVDGRSILSIVSQAEKYYVRLGRGEEIAPAPANPSAFRSFVEEGERRDRTEATAFWRQALAGFNAPTPLPIDLDRGNDHNRAGASYGRARHFLSERVSTRMRQLAESADVTLNTMLMGAWAILLGRFSGESDVVFGTTKSAGRAGGDIGLFLQTVPVRVAVRGNCRVAEFLQNVRRDWLALRTFAEASMTEIRSACEWHRPEPLFDSLVVYEHLGWQATVASVFRNWPVRACEIRAQTRYRLTLYGFGDDAIQLVIYYDERHFSAQAIAAILTALEQLLDEMTSHPEVTLDRLQILTAGERARILTDWNRTATDYPRDVLVPEAIRRQVKICGDRPAVVADSACLTFDELNRRANRLARYLASLGVGAGARVGVHVERSPDMVVALLAVMKSGAAYVPLDPGFPVERLAFIADDAALKVLITQANARFHPTAGTREVMIDGDWAMVARQSDDDVVGPAAPDDAAYVIFTSGSTGRPKGVEVSHRALANFAYAMLREPGVSQQDVLLAVTTISFDIAVLELFVPLMAGATIVLAGRADAANPRALARLLGAHEVTLMQATPATWRMLLDSGWSGKANLKALCGGEALTRDLAANLLPAVRELWNMYGPTETTVWSLVRRIRGSDQSILIGRPIANTTAYILDQDRNPVAIGVTGDLYIGGEGVAIGYLDRPELTRERFLPDPFRPPPARIYATGDRARFWPGGEIECLGRSDLQVKIRGFRVEAGEVEAVLKEHPSIAHAVVVAREHRHGKQLVAYATVAGSQHASVAEVKAFLADRLPDYMVPARLIYIDAFPLTPSGKIDRLSLPEPNFLDTPHDDFIAPRDDFERALCDAWAEVLEVPRIGIGDDFFALGGDSLQAVALMLRVQEILPGEPLLLSELLDAPTVERFASRLRTQRWRSGRYLICIREGRSDRPAFFCVHGAGGNVLSLRRLAMALPPDLPFYGLQAKGLDGSEPFRTVEETARAYVEELRAHQREGPYFLGGGCYGGLVAFEMARILDAQGQRVAALIMIDSTNFAFGRFLSKRRLIERNLRFFASRSVYHLRRLGLMPAHQWTAYLRGRVSTLQGHVRGLVKMAVGTGRTQFPPNARAASIPVADGTELGATLRRVALASLAAASQFVPEPYAGDAVVIAARTRDAEVYEDSSLGWRPVVRGKVSTFVVDGDHDSIFDADVGAVAAIVQSILGQAQTKP